MNNICTLCLTKDRKLFSIPDKHWTIIYSVFDVEDGQYLKYLQNEGILKLCWECRAKLSRFIIFFQLAQENVRLLREFNNCGAELVVTSQSRLKMTQVEIVEVGNKEDSPSAADVKQVIQNEGQSCFVKLEVEFSQPETNPASKYVKVEDSFLEDDLIDIDSYLDPSFDDFKETLEEATPERPTVKAEEKSKPKTLKKKSTEPKCTVQWVTNKQAISWYDVERRAERETYHQGVICTVCQKCVPDETALEAHMEQCHSESLGEYVCNLCKYRFATKCLLRQHIEKHYILYICKKCSFETRLLEDIQRHTSKRHPGKLLKTTASGLRVNHNDRQQCKRCKDAFPDMAALKKHRSTCSTYKCEHCSKTFKYNPAYYQHLKLHRTQEQFNAYCQVCETHFTNANWYKKHFTNSLKHVNRNDLKHECTYCGTKFLTARRLREHTSSIHLKIGINQCSKCDKSYSSRAMLRRHLANMHGEGQVRLSRDKICDVCGKGFTSNHLLNNHLRSHTGEKPFKCELCPSAFAQSGTLYTHNKTVHKKKLSKAGLADTAGYQCLECNKVFGTEAKRKAHFDFYHLKSSKFSCEMCNKIFLSSTSLKNHNAVRHGLITSRSYVCETCGKKFTTASARCQHTKTHNAERHLKCRSCDASFRNTGALYTHYKLKHLKLKKSDRVRIKNLCRLDQEIIVNRNP